MSLWSKIVGGAADLVLSGPLGGLLGMAADRPGDADEDDSRPETRSVAFTIAAIALGAKMAKADGLVTRVEVDAFKQVFRTPAVDAVRVGRVFDRARRSTVGFEAYARQVARLFRDQPLVLEDLVDVLFHIAKADGSVTDDEIAYLAAVAESFGFDDQDFARIRAGHLGPDAADPYVILGISRTMTDDAIKASYRRLVRDNHPDRLIAAGLPETLIGIATDKLATINAAFDRVAVERGFT